VLSVAYLLVFSHGDTDKSMRLAEAGSRASGRAGTLKRTRYDDFRREAEARHRAEYFRPTTAIRSSQRQGCSKTNLRCG
jgi:hypothetical protein